MLGAAHTKSNGDRAPLCNSNPNTKFNGDRDTNAKFNGDRDTPCDPDTDTKSNSYTFAFPGSGNEYLDTAAR